MITKKRVVLETNKGNEFFERFEAIEIIERLSQIHKSNCFWSIRLTKKL